MINIVPGSAVPEKAKVLFSSVRIGPTQKDFGRVFRIELEVETFEDNFECYLAVAALHHQDTSSAKKDSVLTVDIPPTPAKNGQ